ncbi:alpha-mannosidase IC [Tothia fuscella]|uniref:alpha-1,2-Mannosidase n=1 Tax=Tothia fuscella TaxID=1048955 RepID=A0A9P4NYT9_9PEZI|nr:alpha-mannosidase IC [Tothia fuscella]
MRSILRDIFSRFDSFQYTALGKHPRSLQWKPHCAYIATCIFLLAAAWFLFWPARGGLYDSHSGVDQRCFAYTPSRPYKPSSNVTQSKWRQKIIKHPPTDILEVQSEKPKRLRQIQFPFAHPNQTSDVSEKRREAVTETFMRAWTAYKQKAWLKDEVQPMTGKWNNQFGGWGATLIDTLDTLWIFDMKEEFQEAIDAALTVDFNNPPDDKDISIFETTIRFLGGLISAYELPGCRDTRLLDKAIEVGDMLYHAFDNPNRMPIGKWNPKVVLLDGVGPTPPDKGSFVSIGSLSMELTRLSQLTGDMRYFDAVQRLTDILESQQYTTKLPGMWPLEYSWQEVVFDGNSFGLGANADSSYEYLLKMYPLLGGTSQATQYQRMYTSTIEKAMEHNFFRPMSPTPADVLISGKVIVNEDASTTLITESEHLTCFLGGMVGLGGKLFLNASQVDIAEKLTQGCVWAYKSSPSGIMPENGKLAQCPSPASCPWDEELWKQRGDGSWKAPYNQVRDARYLLRPEALESLFYMYRITGESRYQDMAWDMYQTIESNTKAAFGNAELSSVMTNPPPQRDFMQSFWFSEAVKYLYLIFSEPDLVSLDDFVFNTEAHPFRIPK